MNQIRYLIIGRAKTGTTAISKTIQNATGVKNYHLEPKAISFFENLGSRESNDIVKIIFDQWRSRPRLLNAVINNELNTGFINNIFITRDPRGEVVSRVHYVAYYYFINNDTTDDDVERWVNIFKRKENNPDSVSLKDIYEYIRDNFNILKNNPVLSVMDLIKIYSDFVGRVPDNRKLIVRYEDFVSGNLKGHPREDLLTAKRDVGAELERTRRSGGEEDWGAFILPSDRKWIDDLYGPTIEALGYDRDASPGLRAINPEHSSKYVERIIHDARKQRAMQTKRV